MEGKKIDNTIIDNKNNKKEIDNLINTEKNKIKKLNDMQENILIINKNINICVDLLSESIKGKTPENMLNNMYEHNKVICKNLTSQIDESIIESNKTINSMLKDMETKEKENRGDKDANSSN